MCAYRFTSRWPLASVESVGKTLQSGGHIEDRPGSNVDTLTEVSVLSPSISTPACVLI